MNHSISNAPQEYGRYQQHAALINDPLRIALYNYAICSSPPGSLVLDVGAGTGILSLLALKHGYDHAVLVEPSRKIAKYACQLLDDNGFKGRYTIINGALEEIPDTQLPSPIAVDLLVTETISSLGVGFGCWPRLISYSAMMKVESLRIPYSIVVYADLAEKDYSYSQTGINLLKDIGVSVDIAYRTFWSGGNVSDKQLINMDVANGSISFRPALEITLGESKSIDFKTLNFSKEKWNTSSGLISFFKAFLVKGDSQAVLSSCDVSLNSWSPLYIPFINNDSEGGGLTIKYILGDNPYPYYFKVFRGNHPITHNLLW